MSCSQMLVSLFLTLVVMQQALATNDTARLYFEAMERFRRGEVAGAKLLWQALLTGRREHLGQGQVKAIKKWMKEAEAAVHSLEVLPDDKLLQRALNEYREAAPLLAKGMNRQEARERLSLALFYLKKTRGESRKSAKYNYLLGACLHYLGRHEQAKNYAEKAVASAPQKAQPLNLRAELRRLTGDFDGCLADLDKSLRLQPKQKSIALRYARLLLSRSYSGDEEKAAKVVLKAIGDSEKEAEELSASFRSPLVREALASRAAELRIQRARRQMAEKGKTSAFYGEDDYHQSMAAGGRNREITSAARRQQNNRKSKEQNYPGEPGVTENYSGRYRVMGRREFYIIRAPYTRRYLRYEDLRRSRNRPRLWPRPLGEDPYWER